MLFVLNQANLSSTNTNPLQSLSLLPLKVICFQTVFCLTMIQTSRPIILPRLGGFLSGLAVEGEYNK